MNSHDNEISPMVARDTTKYVLHCHNRFRVQTLVTRRFRSVLAPILFHASDLPRKMLLRLNVRHYLFIERLNRLSGQRELENYRGNEIETERHAHLQKKSSKERTKKVLLGGKLVRNIQYCATF